LAVDVLEHQSKFRKVHNQYLEDLQAWQDGLNRSWSSQKRRWGANVELDNRVKRLSEPETVSNSSKPLDYTQTLNQKVAMEYIKSNQSEYESIRKTVLEQNPTANKRDIAEAIAEAMTGDTRGYMTVIRAYKKIGIDL
jgi:PHD/YefM family antitoxin component YafN of YafNO toxin-antitoxin module